MDKTANLIRKERHWMPQLLAAVTIVSISGYATYLFPQHGIWQQWTYLLHTLIGFYLSFVLLPYLYIHFQRTIAFRRSGQVILGLLVVCSLMILAGTGIHIGIFGQYESQRWIYDSHVISSYATLVILIIHLSFHRITNSMQDRKPESSWFITITPTSLKGLLYGTLTAIGLVILLTFIYSQIPSSYQDKATIQPYQLPYGNQPFRPSQAETTSGSFIDMRRIGRSEKCATCHAQITDEWRSSMHGRSASDMAFQTNIHALTSKKGVAATRYCLGCHGPVALLSGQATEGGVLNSGPHISEGVSCMTCHGMSRAIHLKGVASYLFEPQNDYLFGDKDSYIATKVHNYLINIAPRQHRRDMARSIIYKPENCATCHVQYIDKDINNWGWVKLQDQYSAWLNGPYSGQSGQTFSRKQTMRCQDCHFPLVPGDDPSADKNGMVRSHRSPGSNTAIPWMLGDMEQFNIVKEFMQANRIKVKIDTPIRKKKDTGMPVKAKDSEYYYAGDTLNLNVTVTNFFIGHNFPAGTIDINEPWLELRVIDADKNIIYENGGLTENNDVDPDAHFYLSIPIDRRGKRVWRHDLFNVVGHSYENLIPPGKSDIAPFSFTIPMGTKSPVKISARLRYRKFNNKYARWALKDNNIRLPIVDMAHDTITIQLQSDNKPK